MHPVDMPLLDDTITKLPEDQRRDIAALGLGNLFVFANICGFTKLTESCHGPVCVFIDHNKKRFKLILYPRDHYKTSTITIAGGLRHGVRDPEQRILIANETSTNAQRFLRSKRQIMEKNRLFRALYGHVIPKDTRSIRWNDSELDLNRQGYYPEPTFDTIGMTGAMTSRHYTHMIFDDPISEEAIKSDKVMKDTIDRMGALLNLMSEPKNDSFWLVGTRWALHDVYSHHERVYGTALGKLVRAVIEDGKIIFPELIDEETLALMRRSMTPYKFSCLMMNNPRNEELQDLNIQDLGWWEYVDGSETHIELRDASNNPVKIIALRDLDVTTAVDLAPAETVSSDRNAVTTVGTYNHDVVVLDAWAKRCTPMQLIDYLFSVKQRFTPRVFGIEDVAYQKAFKWFLRAEAERQDAYFHIKPVKAIGKKETRIRGLQPIMARNRLYVHARQQMLINEMADFPLGEFDDLVDSLSMHLQLFINQVSPRVMNKRHVEEARIVAKILGRDPDKDNDFPSIVEVFNGRVA